MKKIISVIISVFLVVSALPAAVAAAVAADNTEYPPKREILNALEIMSIENESEYITRKEFFSGLLHMVYDSFEEDALRELLVARGVLPDESDIMFEGDNYITYNDAIAAVVTVLGYDQISKLNGDYPEGYKKVAQEIGLLRGVEGKRTLSIERECIVNLFYNAIRAEPNVISFNGGGAEYKKAKDETILSIERKIYEISGIVEANRYTSLIGETGNGSDQITIDGQRYYINGTNAGELLGSYVKGYVQQPRDDDGKVIFLSPKPDKTSELIIESEDIISVSDDCMKIEYDYKEKSRSKRVNISPKVRVFCNGKFYNKYTDEDFFVQNGYLRLLDNNADNVYDCVFITSYETMIVDYVNVYDHEIYGKYTYPNALNYLKLEEADEDKDIHCYLGNEEVKFAQIRKGDVLTVQRSKGDRDIIANIYISRDIITGKASVFSKEDKTIKINDIEYKVLKEFIEEIKASGDIDLSTEYSFSIDSFGNLAYVDKSKQVSDYCLFYKIFYTEDSEKYSVSYMNDNSEWFTEPLTNKVKYNGKSVAASAVYKEMEMLEPQIALIKCNPQGEINSITTAEIGRKGEKLLAKRPEEKMLYKNASKAFEYILFVEPDAKVFIMPENKRDDKDKYYVTSSSYFESKSYNISAYDVDEFNFSHLFCVTEKEKPLKDQFFVVTKVIQKISSSGETVTAIKGSMGVYLDMEYEGRDEHSLDGVDKGSIIRIHTDNNNRIDYYEEVSATPYTTKFGEDLVIIKGTVLASDYEEGKIKVEWDGNEVCLRNNKSVPVYIREENNDFVAGTPKDLMPGDEVFIRVKNSTTQEIVVMR